MIPWSRHAGSPLPVLCLCGLIVVSSLAIHAASPETPPLVRVRETSHAAEVERIIAVALEQPLSRRILVVSACLLGRSYPPETKKRIKEQHSPTAAKTKIEATNSQPLPVEFLLTSLDKLDCMTFVEHVLALASANRPSFAGSFLPRLVDVMFDAGGQPLLNHLRNHFTSHWAEVNERKGYLTDIARNHPLARCREVWLNRVGGNRTFFIEDRFMIARAPQTYWYFPTEVVLQRKVPLVSGDIVALACDKEGLDVTHLGFFIEKDGKHWLRHASSAKNKVVDQEFEPYLAGKKGLLGIMVLRPRLTAPNPAPYRFVAGR